MAQLAQLTGEMDVEKLREQKTAKLLNPFSAEAMENTDVLRLREEMRDRLRRHVVGDFLNADKGFRFQVPASSTKKEAPISIAPVPRKVVHAAAKVLREQQQAKWALGKSGVLLGPWDVGSPSTHLLSGTRIWVPTLNIAKAKAWPALVELFGIKPWALGIGVSLNLEPLDGAIRRNVLLSSDGLLEIMCDAFGIDAFGDVRMLHDAPLADDTGKRSGIEEIKYLFQRRVTPLFDSGFTRGYYPFDAGDLNPYKWVTFYSRASEAFAKLTSEEKARLERAGGKLHESDFQLGEASQGLKAALLDKLFGGREAALLTIGEALRSTKLSKPSIVPIGCELTVHGVGANPARPITVRVRPPSAATGGQLGTRHAHDRRGVEPKVEISTGEISDNAEGEDQLWRHALEEVSAGAHFLAYISDTDFKEAALVLLPRLLFPDPDTVMTTPPNIGHIMVASVDRSAPQAEKYWSMNEFVTTVATSEVLTRAIPAGTLGEMGARRVRCAHVAAALILMGGDTTPGIHGLTEELGLKLAVQWAWYTGPLVEPFVHEGRIALEVFRLLPAAVSRLHKVWYVLRTTPNIKKAVGFSDERSDGAQRAWFDGLTHEGLTTEVLKKVPPVGVAGQPMRSKANLQIIMIATDARMLQWGLSPCPDRSLFDARAGLKAVEGRQFGPWTTLFDWDLTEVGKKPRETAAAATAAKPPPKISAAELFDKYANDLRRIDELPSRPRNERLTLIRGQLCARGSMASDLKGKSWQQLKRLLLATLNQESPSPAALPTVTAAAVAARQQHERTARTRMAAAPVDVMPSGAEDAATAAAIAAPGEPVAEDDSEPAAEDDSDEEDAASSSEEEDDDDEPAAPHRKFFCCESDEKPGGYWWCASCSKCFHHACKAHAVKENGEPIDGNNKVCKQCHAHIMAPSARASRKRSRDGA